FGLHRFDWSERSVRGAVSGGGKRIGTRSRKSECEWRSDCAGASAGGDRDSARDHAALLVAAAEEEGRGGYGVYRRRARDCYGGGELSVVFSPRRHGVTEELSTPIAPVSWYTPPTRFPSEHFCGIL